MRGVNCPKCGSYDLDVRYHKAGVGLHEGGCGVSEHPDGEHLGMRCRTCGYHWHRETLDNIPSTGFTVTVSNPGLNDPFDGTGRKP